MPVKTALSRPPTAVFTFPAITLTWSPLTARPVSPRVASAPISASFMPKMRRLIVGIAMPPPPLFEIVT
ncbi:hypothetical protein R75461_08001 [Paraburkholderia nemoris]|nr:hypothetical protein R75461_08001 [Paraburkholderia nemoris]